jgi:hypothetical protein
VNKVGLFQQRQHMRIAMRAGGVDRALHPFAIGEVDPVFVAQETANEDRRRHGVERDADPLACKILRRLDAGILVDPDDIVPERARWEHRQRHEIALSGGITLNEFRAGIFGNVEFLATGHAVEDRTR